MAIVPLNRTGLAIDGTDAGLYVRVERVTGGFCIVKRDYADMIGGEHGGDDWVESEAALDRYFSARLVDWTVPETDYEPAK